MAPWAPPSDTYHAVKREKKESKKRGMPKWCITAQLGLAGLLCILSELSGRGP